MITSVFDLGKAQPVNRGGRHKPVTVNGRPFPSLKAACLHYGVTFTAAVMRIHRGWDPALAVSTPTKADLKRKPALMSFDQHVEVQLTKQGAEILSNWSKDRKPGQWRMLEGDGLRCPLWMLMQIFGPYMEHYSDFFQDREMDISPVERKTNER